MSILRQPQPTPRAAAEPEPARTLRERLAALFQSAPLANGLVAVAVTVGFIHGWLKLKIHHPIITFAFDGLLGLSLVVVLAQLPRGTAWMPPGPVSSALKLFYAVCAVYALLPLGPPLLVSAAAFRGWCFATLAFVLGYHLTRHRDQVRGYFYVLIGLGVLTTVYGIQQSPAEVELMIKDNPDLAQRFFNTYYVSSKGAQFRVFSTFISSGAFGGTLAYVIVFALALLISPGASGRERVLLVLACLLMSYGIVISGARSPLLSLALGLGLIGWVRRQRSLIIVTVLAVAAALFVGNAVVGSAVIERYSSLLNWEDIYYRNLIPTRIGWEFALEHPFGGGLGKSGYSVPFFLYGRTGYEDIHAADGDIGRLLIEMGFVGLAMLTGLIWVCLKQALGQVQAARDKEFAGIALANSACFLMAVVSLPSGSPFLGIPMGAMAWFFLGTLHKLHQQSEEPLEEEMPQALPQPAKPAKRFLYYRPPK